MSTTWMQRTSSLRAPLSFVIALSLLDVVLQLQANEAPSLLEHGSLLLGAKIQRSSHHTRHRSLDVAKDDHSAEGWRHLRDGDARLFQSLGTVDGDAKAVPGGGGVRPMVWPFRIVRGKEPIDGEYGLHLLCRN